MKKIKVTAVSYLNTKPLLYGLINHPIINELELTIDIPSVCAQKLVDNQVDLALVPVAAIPQLKTPYIISDFCIGTEGAVQTVCIYADRPIEELDTIYLDYHSRTSVELSKLLLKEYWQLSPRLIHGKEGYIEKIKESSGGLIIGDRTIGMEERFAYTYDLGAIWEQHTGLPFVFAAWVSNKKLSPVFVERFNEALKVGLSQIPALKLLLQSPHPDFDLETYFTKYISYTLDTSKKKALHRFLNYLKEDLQASITESLLMV